MAQFRILHLQSTSGLTGMCSVPSYPWRPTWNPARRTSPVSVARTAFPWSSPWPPAALVPRRRHISPGPSGPRLRTRTRDYRRQRFRSSSSRIRWWQTRPYAWRSEGSGRKCRLSFPWMHWNHFSYTRDRFQSGNIIAKKGLCIQFISLSFSGKLHLKTMIHLLYCYWIFFRSLSHFIKYNYDRIEYINTSFK